MFHVAKPSQSTQPLYLQLATSEMCCLEEAEYLQTCLCATVLCAIIMVHNGTNSPYTSGFDVAWFSSLSSEHLCIFALHSAIYI